MAYRIEPSASTRDEVQRVAAERLGAAIVLLDGLRGSSPAQIEEAVHDVRKRCKETRGLARLVRPALGDDFRRLNHTVRDAANELSSMRDAHALLSTFDDLCETTGRGGDQRLDRVRASQAASAAAATRAISAGDPRIKKARRLLNEARGQVDGWELGDGFAPLAEGLAHTYRRGRGGMKRARRNPTDDRMHEWRKAVKNLWYQVRLLRDAAPSLLRPLDHRLNDLAEALGDDHDLAVLIERLEAEPGQFGGRKATTEAIVLARAAQDDLRVRAFRLGATVYAEAAKAFVTRIETYWTNTIELGPEPKTGSVPELPHGFGPLGRDLSRSYRRGRNGLDAVRTAPADETIQTWRADVAALAAQLRLLAPISPSMLIPLVARLDDLSQALAKDRRYTKRMRRLEEERESSGRKRRKAARKARRAARRKRDQRRRDAIRLGATLFAEPTTAFVARIELYWDQAIDLGPERGTGGLAQLPTPPASNS